jgi:hypothetical protein
MLDPRSSHRSFEVTPDTPIKAGLWLLVAILITYGIDRAVT